MNREIKFRAFVDGIMINRKLCDRSWYTKEDKLYCNALPSDERIMDIMQYSGLKDTDGKDIYEGDVVYLAGYGYYLAEFPFSELYDSASEGDIEGIKGNIYENPELAGRQ